MAQAQSKFAKRLATMQKKYEAAQAPDSPGECNLEPGRYRAKIAGVMKDIGSKLMIEWTYTVVEGDSEGEKVTQLDGLENEKSLGYLKKRVKQLGYDPEDLDLAAQLETILAQVTEQELVGVIQVKQNSDYTNVYLNKVELEESEEDEEEEEESEDDENDSEEEVEEEEEESEDEESEDEEEAEEEDEEEEEEEEEAASIEKGDTVLFQPPKAKKASEFVVLSVDEKKGTAKLKGYPTPVKLSDLSIPEAEEVEEEEEAEEVEEEAEADEDDGSAELEVGSLVEVDIKGKRIRGKVTSIDEDSETCKVKTSDKVVKVSFEQITVLT